MPRIDPEKLLKCIGVLLSPNGGIRSSSEVKRLSGLMEKYCKKLVSKCIYIQILKCTDTELLGEFMEAGGWKLVHGWLKEGIETKNWPLTQELLELLLLCPVDVPRLQSNDAPRLVKGLSREGSGDEGVRILAARLVEQWLKIAKGEKMTIASQNLIVVNKEYVQSSHPTIILNNKGIIYTDPIKDGIDESATHDEPMTVNGIIDRDENDSDKDVVNENNCNEGLVYKFTYKDGKQVLAKVSEPTTPKKLSNRNDGDITSDTDESKLLKVRNTNTTAGLTGTTGTEKKSKDDKESSSKHSSDRSKSKDRSRDKDRKSGSSSSSSHKTSSSKSSSSSSSSKHNSSSGSNNHSSSSSKSHKSSSGSSSSKSNTSSSSSSSSRDKSKDKHRSSSSSTSKSSPSSSSRDKDKRDDKDAKSKSEASKLSQADQDKATLAKVLPQAISKIGKIPKKPSNGDDKSSSEAATDDDKKTISAKKKSISIEVRKDADRPKTVKTYNSQFRSHGLAEEAPPPPSRRDLKKPSATPTPGASIPSNTPVTAGKRSLSPTSSATKDIEKKIKVSSPTSEKPGAIKLIPAKPKPSVLVESDMFMDAISAATNKKEVRKRKRSKESESSASTSKETNGKSAAPMKFYQDTLDDSDAKDASIKDENIKQENDTDDNKIKAKKTKLDDDSGDENAAIKQETDIKSEEPVEEEVFEPVKREPGIGCGPDGPPGVLTLHRRKGPKKSLRWKAQDALEEIRYFELDENERVNVTKTFVDAKQMERVSEREAFLIARKSGNEDIMAEQIPWAPLIPVDDVPTPAVVVSKEKDIQTEREKTCLKTIYFNRSMIPDSPSEPDVIAFQNTEPVIMPLFDITGNPDGIHDFTNMPWPEPKGSPQHIAGGMDDMNGFGNFGQFGQTQIGNMNWPLGQPPNSMMNMRPQQALPPFGAMIPPDGMNQMAFPRNMNPTLPPNFAPNGQPFINNFNASMPAMGRAGANGPQNNWFGGNVNGNGPNNNNNNWQTQQPMAANNNQNNARSGWQGRRLCKQFQRGFCRHGDKCKFLHPGVNCPPF